ncbi:hypothetical protein [Campylobacter devanensis]|uniref:hypothetical protein n=1 Tax=Campylobacter devanensis TaxID=3161138 RepID=UPI000A333DD3|nr:hypothetical protein [Campylobacter sp. P0227]
MGLFDAIGSVIGAVCSAVGSVCSAVGGAIAAGISTLATAIAPYLATVATIVSAIANVLGIFKENDRPEHLAQAMEQMDKKPEDFDSINEYIDYLREGIRSGEVKLNDNLSDIQKAAYTATGAALGIKAIDEKYQLQTSDEFWGAMGKNSKKAR